MSDDRRWTREEWAKAREEGRLYPDSPPGEWRPIGEIVAELMAKLTDKAA